MIDPKKYPIIAETAHQYSTEVLLLADAVGNASVTLIDVMQDFLKVVKNPVIAGGFAVAHHGLVRGTVDIDVISVSSRTEEIKTLVALGYKHESVRIPIGTIDLITKANKGVGFLNLENTEFAKFLVQSAVDGILLNKKVKMVSLEGLILLKLLAARGRSSKKDEMDLDHLLSQNFSREIIDVWKMKLSIA